MKQALPMGQSCGACACVHDCMEYPHALCPLSLCLLYDLCLFASVCCSPSVPSWPATTKGSSKTTLCWPPLPVVGCALLGTIKLVFTTVQEYPHCVSFIYNVTVCVCVWGDIFTVPLVSVSPMISVSLPLCAVVQEALLRGSAVTELLHRNLWGLCPYVPPI